MSFHHLLLSNRPSDFYFCNNLTYIKIIIVYQPAITSCEPIFKRQNHSTHTINTYFFSKLLQTQSNPIQSTLSVVLRTCWLSFADPLPITNPLHNNLSSLLHYRSRYPSVCGRGFLFILSLIYINIKLIPPGLQTITFCTIVPVVLLGRNITQW